MRAWTREISCWKRRRAFAAGIPAVAVDSYHENFKITTPEDLLLAKRVVRTFDFAS